MYLRGGGSLVLVVDPKRRSFRAIDAFEDRVVATDDVFAHPAAPDFSLAVGAFFDDVLHRRF